MPSAKHAGPAAAAASTSPAGRSAAPPRSRTRSPELQEDGQARDDIMANTVPSQPPQTEVEQKLCAFEDRIQLMFRQFGNELMSQTSEIRSVVANIDRKADEIAANVEGLASRADRMERAHDEHLRRTAILERTIEEVANSISRPTLRAASDVTSIAGDRATSVVGDTGGHGTAHSPPTQDMWLPNAIIVGGFENNTGGERIREEITRLSQNMPSDLRAHVKYAYTNGLMDSKGYLRVADGLANDVLWKIVSSLKSNNVEFNEGGSRWASRAKSGQSLAKTAKLRDVLATIQTLRTLPQGQKFLIDPKKLKVLVSPSGETVAQIPFACVEPAINNTLLLSWGIDSASWTRAYKETVERRRFL